MPIFEVSSRPVPHPSATRKLKDEFTQVNIVYPKISRGGFEPIPKSPFDKVCIDPSHNPPMHIHIPAGMQYRHICPSCGREAVIQSPQIMCQMEMFREQEIASTHGPSRPWFA